MRIRSITSFFRPNFQTYRPGQSDAFKKLKAFSSTALERFQNAGYEVQTTRIATVPFLEYLPVEDRRGVVKTVKEMEAAAAEAGFSFLGIGPALPTSPESYSVIPDILAETQNVFVTGMMAASKDGVYLERVRNCARIIHQAARITPDGFTNLRFSALANVRPFCPFFPAGYSDGEQPAFALAIESADEAVAVFERASSFAEARNMLLKNLEEYAGKLGVIAESLSKEFGQTFKGFDISLAPYPNERCSLGTALEHLGVSALGGGGSVAAAAFVADTLDRGAWKRTGFNGLMLPVLEDPGLAQRSADGSLTLKDLLLYSTVCGTGLDTVPLPGDVSEDDIYGILVDIAALSVRLGKQLTARLMPVPGLKAGEATHYQFDYFSNGAALGVPSGKIGNLLTGNEILALKPRQPL